MCCSMIHFRVEAQKKITFISFAMVRVEKNVHLRSLSDRFVCAGACLFVLLLPFLQGILFKSRKTQGEKINMFVHPGRN